MNTFQLALVILGAAALWGGMFYWRRRVHQKRREALDQVATEIRWSFSPERDGSALIIKSKQV